MIDTSKLSRALRVGGAGIRAEDCGGFDTVYLPNNQRVDGYPKSKHWTLEAIAEHVRNTGHYKTWLKRAKCEHAGQSWTDSTSACSHCGANMEAIYKGHYTLLPDPAYVCVVAGCGEERFSRASGYAVRRNLCPAHECEICDQPDWHVMSDEAVRAWAAKQSEGGGATSEQVPTSTGNLRPTTAGPGDEPGSVHTVSNAAEQKPPVSIESIQSAVRELSSTVFKPYRWPYLTTTHWPGVTSPMARRVEQQIAEDVARKIRKREGLTAKCKECGVPNADVLKQLCVYCERRLNSIESARADLDRPLTERIERARQELGYDDGYGVYSLPCESAD